ncbi:MAG: MAPEG family protein [Neisseriaceae bacterium]|nr:MAPEG family protein [Neisseriaceae bacterium]
MTTAYWCIFIFMWFPLLTILVGKIAAGNMVESNHDPRAYLESKVGFSKRMYNAHFNAFEMFAPFAAAVIIAQLVGALPQSTIDNIAIAFLVSRVIYALAYGMDWALFRTIIWFVGLILISCLFILPLF